MSRNNSDLESGIQLLFQRPNEPLFTAKDNGKTAFELPPNFYTKRYQNQEVNLSTRIGENVERTVSLRSIQQVPDLEFTKPVERTGTFSLFSKTHQSVAGSLIQLLLDTNIQDFLSVAAYIKDRVNPYLYLYALAVACQHRKDTQHISLPSIVQQFPDQFVDSSVFPRAREEGSLFAAGDRMPVEIQMKFTASDREQEQRLAYFREDIGVNMHHWHWHLVYPNEGPLSVVAKDRRGELFYYMHSQLIARYNNDRFCNHLEQVKPLNNLRESVREGYFPKIVRGLNNRAYPGRHANALLHDVNRGDDSCEIADIERWRDRIHEAIDQGYVVEKDTHRQILLDEKDGIDVLGNILESSAISPNRQLYGNLHNMGHNIVAFVHDPDGRHLEDYGVMADVGTAMRDPVFYRWHTFINSICIKYKKTLQPYKSTDLLYEGVNVQSVNVQIITKSSKTPTPDLLLTYWQRSDVDLGAGLDFGPGNVYAQFTHLQHAPFEYHINVKNETSVMKQGTCRIFLIPQRDERDEQLRFREQRYFAIEMDKFVVNLNPGVNEIRRRSMESSVTIPYERSFRRIGSMYQPKESTELSQFQFCGCGWPNHMLLPKGTPAGTKYDIFVMISDYELDRVDQTSSGNASCNDALSFCGLKDQKYPDKRKMGYPFDKRTSFANNQDVRTLKEFTEHLSNAALGECTIRFTNAIIDREN